MELPNYSRQLMQQLLSLRKEGQFCDCTIMVGDNPHQAHKLVLAAASLLFRSLLEGSDSISIDTTVVSTQEFSCLLDMVYTGKLPPGKHNFTRIIAAADSLQMFDVAVGCKNILTTLMKRSTTPSPSTTSVTIQPQPTTIQSQGAEMNSPKKVAPSPGMVEASVSFSGAQVKREREKVEEGGASVGGVETDTQEVAKNENYVSTCKRPRLQVPECTGSDKSNAQSGIPPVGEANFSESVEKKVKLSVSAGDGNEHSVFLERNFELMELLAELPSIHELLAQAATACLGEDEREVVRKCCEMGDPGLTVQSLMEQVKEGSVSEEGLESLLSTVQEMAPTLSLRMSQLLEGRVTALDAGGSEEESQEPQPISSGPADEPTNEEEEGKEDKADDSVDEKDGELAEDEEDGARKTKAKAKAASSQPYSCRWCSKTFAYKCRLAAHTKSCSLNQEAKQRCPRCPEVLPTVRALQRHSAHAHPEATRAKRKVVCDLCGRTFAHPSGMLYHKRTEHFEEKPFACEECGAKFAANSSLKNHMRLHTGEKPYHCKHCDMSFSVAAALAYHTKKKHSEGKMYSCQYCEAVFAQSIELTRHVRTHTGDKPYVCRECGKGFSQANGLSVHLQTFHNITEPHDCQKCRLSFPSLEDHRKHIQESHPKEFHQCLLCQKTFSSATLLDKHKANHTGGKPFSCKICHKSYQQLSGLWYHNRTTHPEVFAGQSHKQLKTLVQCSTCPRFFPSPGSLAKHMRADHPGMTDADELGIRCDLSSDTSAVKCPYCPALFPSKEELQEHARSDHFNQEGAAFGCSLCPLVCPSQLQLQEHFLSCHVGALQGGDENASQTTKEQEDGAEHEVISLDTSQIDGAQQQVYVALGDGEGGHSPTEVLAVNVEDLLNGTVTFICREGQ